MESAILKDLGIDDAGSVGAAEYASQCVELYERTLRAMGIGSSEVIGVAVDNSQLVYANPSEVEGQYADLQQHY